MSAAFDFTHATHRVGGGSGYHSFGPGSAELARSDAGAATIFGDLPCLAPDTRRAGVVQPRLHDAYMRTGCELVANSVVELLKTGKISFVVDQLLPLLYHPNPIIHWKETWEDNGLMEPEQEGGVAPVKTVSTADYSAYMTRFSRGILVSDGFHNTEEGRELFKLRVAHLLLEIHRTLDIHGLYAIAGVHNHYARVFSNRIEDATNGRPMDPIDAYEREIATFSLLNKDERALYTLDERLGTMMESNGGNPDTWLMLSEAMSHVALESAEVEAYRAGDRTARRNLREGKDAIQQFRGRMVHEVHDYDVYGRSVNALKRTRVIGDFWAVRDFGYRSHGVSKLSIAQRCQTDVYCCGTDRFENFSLDALLHPVFEYFDDRYNQLYQDSDYDIPFEELVKQVLNIEDTKIGPESLTLETPLVYYNSDDKLSYLFADFSLDENIHLLSVINSWLIALIEARRYPAEFASVVRDADGTDTMQAIIDMENTPPNAPFRRIWSMYLKALKGCHAPDKAKLIDGMPYPLSAICYRPFRRYTMGSAVLMQSGMATGFTAHAHADVQVNNDAQSKSTFLHFTGNFASVVTDPRRIAVAPDVFCCSYEGGEDRHPVDIKEFKKYCSDPMSYGRAEGNLGRDVFVVPGPCLACADIAEHAFTRCTRPVDISGMFRMCTYGKSNTPGYLLFEALYNMKSALDIDMPNGSSDSLTMTETLHSEAHINSTCFAATQRVPSKDGANGRFIRGTDHFGDWIGPGSREARNGAGIPFKRANFEEMNLVEVR